MSKPKIILFDVDGVLICLPNYFTKELENKGYAGAEEVMNPFYRGEINWAYTEGRSDAREMVGPYLEKFGWKGTAQEYFDEQFQFERRFLDQDLIALVVNLKNQDVLCCLATDQEKYRAKFLMDEMDFKNIFDKYYFSCEIGKRKCADEFWKYVLWDAEKDLPGIQPWEIVYFDDIQKNIEIASSFGIQSFLFTDKLQFENDMNMLGFDVSLNKFLS